MVKGVRENTARYFEKLGVLTVRDALYFFPRRYDDFSALKPISALTYGQVETIIGTIWNVETKRARSNRADGHAPRWWTTPAASRPPGSGRSTWAASCARAAVSS